MFSERGPVSDAGESNDRSAGERALAIIAAGGGVQPGCWLVVRLG
jgi:hypothetical protein